MSRSHRRCATLRGRSGIARSLYVTASGRRVVILRTFVKKTQKTPRQRFRTQRRFNETVVLSFGTVRQIRVGQGEYHVFAGLRVVFAHRFEAHSLFIETQNFVYCVRMLVYDV